MESLFSPSVGRILDHHIAKVRVMTFKHAALLLASEYASLVQTDVARRHSRRWNAVCNKATAHHLLERQNAGVLTRIHGFHFHVPDVYQGEWYLADQTRAASDSNSSLIRELGKALFIEHENLKVGSLPLYIREDLMQRDYINLEDEKAWLLTSHLVVTSVYLKLATSISANERLMAESWQLNDAHLGTGPFRDFVDAVVLNGKVSICCPIFQEAECSVATFIRYLERVDLDLRGKSYLLCAPWGFTAYRKSHGHFPWQIKRKNK